MESNREESRKCLRISNECLAQENFEKALKFAKKSLQLFPSKEAEDLLDNIKRRMSHGSHNSTRSQAGDGLRNRHGTSNGSASHDEPSSSPSDDQYTSEQLEAVNRIQKCKDYYEILGVSKDATEGDMKRSYRKLALQFHPDKNRAPGATEAFKKISNAFGVLNDADKRRKYDMYGEEESRSPGRTRRYDYTHGGFEADINPEDLFNMFFGGGTFSAYSRQTRPRYHYQTHRRERQQQSDSGLNLFFQLSPILMMAVISLLGILLQSDDPYRFVSNQKYSIARETHNLHVRYFVTNTFSTEYRGPSLTKIEREIESIYINNLRNDCYKEQMQRENLRWKARYRNDGKAYEQASKMELKSCVRLQEIYG